MDAAIDAGVDHVSAYALVVEDGTALARRVRRGELAAPDDDVLAHRYELVDERLSAAGFDWYEVSNWSRPGGQCRHNLGYWDGGQWWGAGPGAHSYVGATRWWNVKHPNAYAQILDGGALAGRRFRAARCREPTHRGRAVEDSAASRAATGTCWTMLSASAPISPSQDGLLAREGERLVLTDRGRLLADGIVRNLLA